MSEPKSELTMYQLADQFIALANQLSQQENDIGKVGTALRYAASRYNAFEAAVKSSDLAAEKDNALAWFTNEFKEMLNENLEDHIKHPPVPNTEEAKDDAVEVFKG
ncbi:DUF3144 domain-containing protein [Shewanella aestuarii]|uniref:DUF3144 domain-containing protein n=1 Tax=Shewanella aestuarii TaxID=1028752 RepID=A0A6G9QI51_9GAMM|nr:DUF3144 domain-containing protein [Shewanella aestuarii]QIR13737.1 DUF3144 domain-containing protein [Shewanella aestuarii]